MLVSESIAGRIGSAVWRTNPAVGLGAAFGVGAGGYAGAHTYFATDGTSSEKSDAARSSGAKYLLWGSLGMTGALTSAMYLPGGPVGWAARSGAARTGRYVRSIGTSFRQGGISRVAERGLFMAGAGAAVGAALGAYLDKDPEHGAKRGAVLGATGGLVVAGGMRASRAWKGLGSAGHVGAIGLLAAGAFAGTAAMSNPRYAAMDQAVRGGSTQDRMNAMSASGDLVFGLHNSR